MENLTITQINEEIARINAAFGVRAVFPEPEVWNCGGAGDGLEQLMEENRDVLRRLKESE